MSGLDEAGVIPYLGHEPYDPEVRDSVRADVLAILLAAAPALLRAVVAEMHGANWLNAQTRQILETRMLAALSRLGRADPKEGNLRDIPQSPRGMR